MGKKIRIGFGKEASWGPLLNIYKTVKIPWFMLFLVVAISFGSQYIAVIMARYSAKIDTGTMAGGSFVVGFAIFTLISLVLEYGYDLANSLGRAQMGRNVRRQLWGRMLRLPMGMYDRDEPQRLVSRVTKDTEFAYGAITAIVQAVSLVFGMTIAMIEVVKIFGVYSWIMAAIIPVLIVCSIIVGKIQYYIDRLLNANYSKMTNFYSERLPNMTYIKTNNMEAEEYKKGLDISNEKYKVDITYKAWYALGLPIQSLANYISLIFVLWVSSSLVRNGSMASVQMKELLNYFDIVMANATLMLGIWQVIKASHGGCEKIAEINASPIEDLSGTTDLQGQHDIVFDQVSFGYTSEKTILKDVSFHIPHGKTTVIVGENGSGKSTIIRLLERFDSPMTGDIRIGQHKLNDVDGIHWRDLVGYVSQGNQMVEGTVRENIVYGIDREYSEEEFIQAVKDAGAYDFIMEKEQQFDTPIHVFESEFSGGQIQRLAIARVLMKNPEYMIMDEATSGIDHIKECEIVKNIKERMSQKTIIAISHNMDFVKSADHVIVLNKGYIEAEGSVEDVTKSSQMFQAFLKTND